MIEKGTLKFFDKEKDLMGVKSNPFSIVGVNVTTTNFATLHRLRTKINLGPNEEDSHQLRKESRPIERNI